MADYQYAQCRAWGHAWRPTKVDVHGNHGARVYVQHLECRTCGTTKSVKINKVGALIGTNYSYPDDYQLEGRTTKARNRQMRRLHLGIR